MKYEALVDLAVSISKLRPPCTVSILAGGITNQLYRVQEVSSDTCAHPLDEGNIEKEPSVPVPKEGKSVVVRVFGRGTEEFISRSRELHYQSKFLTTHGGTDHVLLYEFLDGYVALDHSDMKRAIPESAVALAKFHMRATVSTTCDAKLDPAFLRDSKLDPVFLRDPVHARACLVEWLSLLLRADPYQRLRSDEKREELKAMRFVEDIAQETSWLLQQLDKHEPKFLQVVCHNDLLAGNIMVGRETIGGKTRDVRFIDFEYCRRNYVYFDMANHFNEFAGLGCDYETYFPSDEDIKRFLNMYTTTLFQLPTTTQEEKRSTSTTDGAPESDEIHFSKKGSLLEETNSPTNEQDTFLKLLVGDKLLVGLEETNSPTNEQDTFLKLLVGDVAWSSFAIETLTNMELSLRYIKFFSLVSHAIWTIWSLLQEFSSEVDFDYLQYAALRWRRYCGTKAEFALR